MEKDNRGAIWSNKRKTKETDPQWTGSATIDGVEYWVSSWPGKKDVPGSPSLTFSFRKKDQKAPGKTETFGEIPF